MPFVNTTKQEAKLDLAVACPACQSPADESCTVPTDAGRRPVTWTHSMRHDARVGWL